MVFVSAAKKSKGAESSDSSLVDVSSGGTDSSSSLPVSDSSWLGGGFSPVRRPSLRKRTDSSSLSLSDFDDLLSNNRPSTSSSSSSSLLESDTSLPKSGSSVRSTSRSSASDEHLHSLSPEEEDAKSDAQEHEHAEPIMHDSSKEEAASSLQSQAETNDGHFSEEEDAEQEHASCMICNGPLVPGVGMVACTNPHKFHTGCLYKSRSDGKESCPVCREPFADVMKSELTEYGERAVLLELADDPAFEGKFMENGVPIGLSDHAVRILSAVCEKIRSCVLRFKEHRCYAGIFDDDENNPEFYIPQNVVSYFETTRPDHHDPRSKGFKKHETGLIRRIKKYLRSRVVDEDIEPALMSLLGVFCIEDAIMEYLHTELCRTNNHNIKRQKINGSPIVFPALHALITEFPDLSITHIYHDFINEIMNECEDNAARFCAVGWLESF